MAEFVANTLSITIDGTDYSANAVFPLTWNELLDEQLDEMTINLLQVSTPIFKPYKLVKITISGTLDGVVNGTPNSITKRFYTFDDKADEIPSGSGKYNHELYCIEETKILEKIIVRSIGFKNSILKSPQPVAINSDVHITYNTGAWSVSPANPLYTPQNLGDTLTLPASNEVFNSYNATWLADRTDALGEPTAYFKPDKLSVYNPMGVKVLDVQSELNVDMTFKFIPQQTITFSQLGIYRIEYSDIALRMSYGGAYGITQSNFTYYIVVVSEQSALQAWNGYTVAKRALIVAEPLRKGETPRYSIEGDNANANIIGKYAQASDIITSADGDYYYNTTSKKWYIKSSGAWSETTAPLSKTALWLFLTDTPEFNFTQSTLREILQNIGSYVHGEPRLTGNVISYDRYGGNTISALTYRNYASKSVQINGDRYVNTLDSTVNNLVNSIGYARGTITEPYNNGLKTLRTETLYARIDETNGMIAETTYGIRSVSELKIGLVGGQFDTTAWYDLTGFVFEINEYQRLSSYTGAYPTSKAYALYYTQGQPNINGFLFKAESAAGVIIPTLNRYTILNILNAITGHSYTSISDLFGSTGYDSIALQITYEPFASVRVQQSKMLIDTTDGQDLTMVFNADQNIVESHFFGEKLKGQIAKLGNVDKTLTYVFNGLPVLPRVGDIWTDKADGESNEDYYISALAVEINPYNTKFTMALSQNFNKYSDYVGINSTKRYAEVSETQAYDSQVVYKDYVIVGTQTTSSTNDALINTEQVLATFDDSYLISAISCVVAKGEDKDGNALASVILPVYAVAMGNSAVFTFTYADNYSAGNTATWVESGSIQGYFQNGASYTDYFGNLEYLHLNYYDYIAPILPDDNTTRQDAFTKQTEIGTALPYIDDDLQTQIGNTTPAMTTDYKVLVEGEMRIVKNPLWVAKGSTEKLAINYQVNFVSNSADVIVGSALAKNFKILSGKFNVGTSPKVYALPNGKKPYKFSTVVDLTDAEYLGVTGLDTSDAQFKCFAYSTDVEIDFSSITFEDNEDKYIVVVDENDELLFAFNRKYHAFIYLTPKHKIY